MKKMKLNDLKVKSFQTSLNQFNKTTIKGGATTGCIGTVLELSGSFCTAGKNCSNGCSDGDCGDFSKGLLCTAGKNCSNGCSNGNCVLDGLTI